MSDADTSSADLLRRPTRHVRREGRGRGQVVAFRQELLDTASARSELAASCEARKAADELQLHYQPVVNLDDGSTVGVEPWSGGSQTDTCSTSRRTLSSWPRRRQISAHRPLGDRRGLPARPSVADALRQTGLRLT